MSIQNEPDARDLRYLKLISGRASGLSDVEIAQQVGGAASPQELYERIKEDGHPICPKCGTTYVDDTHCEAPGEIPGKRGGDRRTVLGCRKSFHLLPVQHHSFERNFRSSSKRPRI